MQSQKRKGHKYKLEWEFLEKDSLSRDVDDSGNYDALFKKVNLTRYKAQ